jgi:guanylate kinase
MSSKRGNLFVISAASGSGKSTIVEALLARLGGRAKRVVTCTTRRPRGAERDGVDYHFLTVEEFERRIAAGDFLEYARVHGDRLYGTSREAVEAELERGVDLFLVIDVQGAAEVRAKMPSAVTVFVFPPSYASLEERLRRRAAVENHTDEEDLATRLATARAEVRRYTEFQYVIINDDLDGAVETLECIVTAERSHVAPQRERIEEILKSFGVESLHA